MQKLEFKDIKGLDAKEIDAKVADIKRNMFDLRMQKATSGIEKPHQLKVAKKNIAKLMTAKNAKGDK
jgi:large subunit ribosomal protein L29